MPRQKIVERLKAQELARADGVAPLAEHGTNQHTAGGDNVTSSKRGNSADYLVAKLKRDAPAYAERLAAGEYRSARAAAIAAGLVVPIMDSVYISVYIRWIFQRKFLGGVGWGVGVRRSRSKGGHGRGVDPGGAGDRWAGHAIMRRSASADCGLCLRAMHRRVLS